MAISIVPFGKLPGGEAVEKITMTNQTGTAVSLLSFGATVQTLLYRGKDIVLGYDTIEDYLAGNAYIGATVGRFCNRIDKGRFTLDGVEYTLACNDGDNHLHGGAVGYSHRVWTYAVLQEAENPSVRFSLHSPDGEEGYPGNLDVAVTLTLTEDDALSFHYEATGDQATPVNLTNHTYFNLNGCDSDSVHNTYLRVDADTFTAVDEGLIPTGEYVPVEGTPMDLRQNTLLGDVFASTHPWISPIGGIDHNFVLAEEKRPITDVVWAYSPSTGITMTCATDLPGVQIYTGNATNEKAGKYGRQWGRYQGFCVETQYFPDSVNHPQFPSVILQPGETFDSVTTYRFGYKGE